MSANKAGETTVSFKIDSEIVENFKAAMFHRGDKNMTRWVADRMAEYILESQGKRHPAKPPLDSLQNVDLSPGQLQKQRAAMVAIRDPRLNLGTVAIDTLLTTYSRDIEGLKEPARMVNGKRSGD